MLTNIPMLRDFKQTEEEVENHARFNKKMTFKLRNWWEGWDSRIWNCNKKFCVLYLALLKNMNIVRVVKRYQIMNTQLIVRLCKIAHKIHGYVYILWSDLQWHHLNMFNKWKPFLFLKASLLHQLILKLK